MINRFWAAVRFIAISGIALTLVTCTDTPISTPFDVDGPAFEIFDGATGGNEDVFFLPPLTSDPSGSPKFGDRPFNPDLEGGVFAKVCTLDGNSVVPPPACVDEPGDVADLPMALDVNHYHVDWNAKGIDTKKFYRINIFIGSVNVGHRDVDPGKGGSCKVDDPFCTFKSNVPIKVRIESGAVCLSFDPDYFDGDPNRPCATANLGEGESLALTRDGRNVGVATVNDAGGGTATINMQTCDDFRERGLVDLPTFGDCVVVDGLDFEVFGTATVCNAFDEGLAEGVSPRQMGRATVHRFSTDPGFEGVVALPHSEFEDACNEPAPVQGRIIDEFSNLQVLAMSVRRAWWAIADQVRSWTQPLPLFASAATICNRGGCAGDSEFRSDFQAALSAGIDHHPANPGGELGIHQIGSIIPAMLEAWDSGECDPADGVDCGDATAEVPDPEPVNDVRLTVEVTSGSAMVGDGTNGFSSMTTIFTDPDGVGSFEVFVGSGESTIEVRGIGVAVGQGNVQAPSLHDNLATPVAITDDEALTFVVTGTFSDLRRDGEIAIYKNYNAWFGSNKDETVLQAAPFNFVSGTEYVVRSMSELSDGIPSQTSIVIITSASDDNLLNQITDQNNGAAALDTWVNGGGWLVIHAGDNSDDDYDVPGLSGAVDEVLNCNGLTLAIADHAFIRGPDATLGTPDDLTDTNIDNGGLFCYDNHGSLSSILPADAEVLMVEEISGKPVYATYPLGLGRVIVTTLTLEFAPHSTQTLINHFYWAINGINASPAPPVPAPLVAALVEAQNAEVTLNSDGTPKQ